MMTTMTTMPAATPAAASPAASSRKRKAERIQERQRQQPLDEHELDLFLGAETPTTPAATDIDPAPSASVILHAGSPGSELLPGMVLLRGFLSPAVQQRLVDEARRLGLGVGGFYKPTYASGAKCRLHQMCLGRHWNVVTEAYEGIRSNHDRAPVAPLPDWWRGLAEQSLALARDVDPRVLGDCRRMAPDVCVVNYYKKAGRNGMHIDKDESPEAMAMGSPVISFSIGAAADFAFADHYPEAREAVPVVRLESGDVLVFGGPSRNVVHALTRVYPHTEPSWLRMRQGRLNLTFREYRPAELDDDNDNDDDKDGDKASRADGNHPTMADAAAGEQDKAQEGTNE